MIVSGIADFDMPQVVDFVMADPYTKRTAIPSRRLPLALFRCRAVYLALVAGQVNCLNFALAALVGALCDHRIMVVLGKGLDRLHRLGLCAV